MWNTLINIMRQINHIIHCVCPISIIYIYIIHIMDIIPVWLLHFVLASVQIYPLSDDAVFVYINITT